MRVIRMCAVFVAIVCAAGAVSAQTEWVEHPDNPIIGLGEPGTWDAFYRSAGSVTLVGSTYHLWFTGWDGEVSRSSGVGHATSEDGVVWTMDDANPVLTGGDPGEWDERGLWLPQVVFDGTQFHMWYGGIDGDNVNYRGGYATSPDGVAWTKHPDNPVMDLGPQGSWEDRQVRPGGVVLDGETFHMWYTGWGQNTGVQIGYAKSTDGVHWERRAHPVIEANRVSYPGAPDMWLCNPSVVSVESTYHMFYACDGSGGGYAVSADGISWSLHRENPVLDLPDDQIASVPVFFDGATWHMWFTQRSSQGSDRISYATSDRGPIDPAMSAAEFIPAAAYAAGAEGSFYETDLDLSNASDRTVEFQLQWLPRDENNSEPTTSEIFTLGAGKSVRYANVLSEVFGLEPDSFGALALLSTSPDLKAMARIVNLPQDTGAGCFGQAIPALSFSEFTGFRERRRLLFGTENADSRFNVGCLNASSIPARVSFELFRSDGALLGSESILLMPFDNTQLNRIFDAYHPVVGYVDYWSAAATEGRIWCYGSVLDNVTSDPTTVPPQ